MVAVTFGLAAAFGLVFPVAVLVVRRDRSLCLRVVGRCDATGRSSGVDSHRFPALIVVGIAARHDEHDGVIVVWGHRKVAVSAPPKG